MQKNQIMKKISTLLILTLSLLFAFSSSNIYAQNDINKTDNQGRRQGKWIDFHENGSIRYTGEFKNNEPVGEFLYYSEDGTLFAKNKHIKKTHICESEIYSPEGNIIAKGKYCDKKKIDKWEYFSEKNGALILVENYENGKIIGKSIAYSPINQAVIEETEYVDGLKNGVYNKYYDNGKIMVKANYKNDILDGEYVSYYPNGVVKEEGLFSEGQKIGEWKTYDMEEGLLSVDVYSDEE